MTQEVSLICGALALTNLRYILARANLLPCYFQKACNSYWYVITQTVVSVWSLIFWKAVGVCLPQVRPQVHNGLLKHLSPTVTMIGCFSSVRVFFFFFLLPFTDYSQILSGNNDSFSNYNNSIIFRLRTFWLCQLKCHIVFVGREEFLMELLVKIMEPSTCGQSVNIYGEKSICIH